MNVKHEIERHRLPCGPMTVDINGVCRRRLHDHFDRLLDTLTKEVHPEGRNPEEVDLDDATVVKPEETRAQKKKRMIEEGKLRAEVQKEVAKFKEQLMGNSKLLQDISGKINKR